MTVNNWGAARKTATTILEGDFTAVVTEAAAGKSADGNKDNIKVKLAVTSGDFAGRKLFDTLTISPESGGAMAMFFKAMEAFGMGDEFFATCPAGSAGVALMAAKMQGKEVTVTMKGEVFQGIKREKVKGYGKAGVGGGTAGGLAAPVVLAAAPLVAPVPVATSTPPPVFGGDTPAQTFANVATVAALTSLALADAASSPAQEAASSDPYDTAPAF